MPFTPGVEAVPLSEVPMDKKLPDEIDRPVVLIVDDECIIADTLSIILSKSGYCAIPAYNGREALEMAEAVSPQLLITDVMMPGMTGIELAIKVTESLPDCKVLLFSGQAATTGLLQKAEDAGHEFAIMAKPVHPADMLRRVREHLGSQEPVSAIAGARGAENAAHLG
jgi:CheY-like chemotaxis protein